MNGDYEKIPCAVCGKMFYPSMNHALMDGRGNLVCSPHCSTAAYERDRGKKDKAQSDERRVHQQRGYYQNRKAERNGETVKHNPRLKKPVCVIKKDDGTIMNSYPSMTEASKATGFSITTISNVCNGLKQTRGIYTFAFENPDGNPQGNNAIWNRKPASKPIMQFNLRGELIARYESQKEAAEKTGIPQSNISCVCLHKYHQTNGFIFMFESEFKKKGNNNDENNA